MLSRDTAKQNLRVTNTDDEWHPKYIDAVAALYICALIGTWVTVAKMFVIGPVVLTAATLVYPLTCIFGDVLTEIYGFNRTRRLIWMGFACGLLFLLFTQVAIALPPAPDFKDQQAYRAIYGTLPRIVVSSYFAYLCCEFTNSFIMSKMKIWSNGRNFSLRAIASTLGAQLVDSVVFFVMAFLGTVPTTTVISLVVTTWIFKSLYEILALPITAFVVRRLKILEGVEHFDRYKLQILKF